MNVLASALMAVSLLAVMPPPVLGATSLSLPTLPECSIDADEEGLASKDLVNMAAEEIDQIICEEISAMTEEKEAVKQKRAVKKFFSETVREELFQGGIAAAVKQKLLALVRQELPSILKKDPSAEIKEKIALIVREELANLVRQEVSEAIKREFSLLSEANASASVLEPPKGESSLKREVLQPSNEVLAGACDEKWMPPAPILESRPLKGASIRSIAVLIPQSNEEYLLLPDTDSRLGRLLRPFFGTPLSADGFVDLQKQLVLHLRDKDQALIDLKIDPASIASGNLEIEVKESTLGRIFCRGNTHFNNMAILSQFTQKEGEIISLRALASDLQWANMNPFRQCDAMFLPSDKQGALDVEILVKDRRFYRLYAGADNTGLSETGQTRWFTGFNYGNVFNAGHRASIQFTTGNSFSEFHAYTGQYVIPLPWHHQLSFYGGYSSVEGSLRGLEESGFKTHGLSMQASGRYAMLLPSFRQVLHQISIGYDWKGMNTNLNFSGDLIFGRRVNISQSMANYDFGYENPWLKISMLLDGFWSPCPMMGDQSNADFNSLRQYAKNRYVYVRGLINPIFRHCKSKVAMNLVFRGQYSSANLLASEQMGIGGYNSVRGYEERELNGDSGIIFNGEILLPPFSWFRKSKIDSMVFLFFYDYGLAYLHKAAAGVSNHAFLDSVGIGARYEIDGYLSMRGDVGYRIHTIPGVDHGFRFHYSCTIAY